MRQALSRFSDWFFDSPADEVVIFYLAVWVAGLHLGWFGLGEKWHGAIWLVPASLLLVVWIMRAVNWWLRRKLRALG